MPLQRVGKVSGSSRSDTQNEKKEANAWLECGLWRGIGKVTCRVDQRLILEADRRLDSTR